MPRGARYAGAYYRLNGAHAGPPPAHRIGIWLGAYRPRMLALTGRLAEGWIPSASYLPPERLAEAHARIDDAPPRLAGTPPRSSASTT